MSLERHADFIRFASKDCSNEVVDERLRFGELIAAHVDAKWIHPDVEVRLLNFACNPANWETWKADRGDWGMDELPPESNGRG